MIEIRCKFCHGLAAELSDDATCTLRIKCRKCKRVIEITYPIRREDRASRDESAATQNVLGGILKRECGKGVC